MKLSWVNVSALAKFNLVKIRVEDPDTIYTVLSDTLPGDTNEYYFCLDSLRVLDRRKVTFLNAFVGAAIGLDRQMWSFSSMPPLSQKERVRIR